MAEYGAWNLSRARADWTGCWRRSHDPLPKLSWRERARPCAAAPTWIADYFSTMLREPDAAAGARWLFAAIGRKWLLSRAAASRAIKAGKIFYFTYFGDLPLDHGSYL